MDQPAPTPVMTIQPITYRGRTVAAATRRRFFLADELEQGPVTDPDRTFVIFMCAYAADVLAGVLPGPYRDDDARRYARYCLLTPGVGELLERDHLDIPRAARALRMPADELRVAIADWRRSFIGTPSAPGAAPRRTPPDRGPDRSR